MDGPTGILGECKRRSKASPLGISFFEHVFLGLVTPETAKEYIAATASLIGTSNLFELAVAVAISLFGLNHGAALAMVVGVIFKVSFMLSLVAFANRTKRQFVS